MHGLAPDGQAVIYHVVADKASYRELGGDFHDRKQRSKVTGLMVERLEKLGYKVTLEELKLEMAPSRGEDVAQVQAPKKKLGRPGKCAERGIDCRHAAKWADKISREAGLTPDQSTDSTADQFVGFSRERGWGGEAAWGG